MSAIKSYEIVCDGADETCEALMGGTGVTAYVLRVLAREKGWANRGGKDFCPIHNPGRYG